MIFFYIKMRFYIKQVLTVEIKASNFQTITKHPPQDEMGYPILFI